MNKNLNVKLFSFLSLIIITLLTSNYVFASTFTCDAHPKNNLFLGNPDYDAVELCGLCYVCGEADGVCPEDFGNTTNTAKCIDSPDPDCPANVEGYVRELLTDNEIVNAKVSIIPPASSTTLHPVVVFTDTEGYYRVTNVTSGRWIFRAEKPGYDTEVKNFILEKGGTNIVNFLLPEGTCNQDCTNSFGRCSAECAGVNGCVYDNPTVQNLCDDRSPGSFVITNTSGEFITKVGCCRGQPVIKEFRPKARVYGDMENLVTRSVVLTLNGEPVTIHFSIWDK